MFRSDERFLWDFQVSSKTPTFSHFPLPPEVGETSSRGKLVAFSAIHRAERHGSHGGYPIKGKAMHNFIC